MGFYGCSQHSSDTKCYIWRGCIAGSHMHAQHVLPRAGAQIALTAFAHHWLRAWQPDMPSETLIDVSGTACGRHVWYGR